MGWPHIDLVLGFPLRGWIQPLCWERPQRRPINFEGRPRKFTRSNTLKIKHIYLKQVKITPHLFHSNYTL